MRAFDNAYRASESRMDLRFLPKTKQEILDLCALHPENPVARDLVAAVAPYGDGHIHYVLPISIQAVQENREVRLVYRMAPVRNPATGEEEYKRVQCLELGPSLDAKEGEND